MAGPPKVVSLFIRKWALMAWAWAADISAAPNVATMPMLVVPTRSTEIGSGPQFAATLGAGNMEHCPNSTLFACTYQNVWLSRGLPSPDPYLVSSHSGGVA